MEDFELLLRSDQHNQTEEILDLLPPVLQSYHHVLIIIPAYFALVKIFGPKIMSNRKPFELKGIITIYNIGQISMNVFLLYKYTRLMGYTGINFWSNICQPVSEANTDNPFQEKMMEAMYYYYVNKIVDLMDTVFFILRKKDSQVTFLHLFHHMTMVGSTWMSIVYVREEISVIFAGMNALIHVVMYTYYLLASFGPAMQKYLWWKRYITRLQIVQFVTALTCLAKMKLDGCQTNPLFWAMWAFNISAFLGLFTHFYIKSYMKKSKTA